MTRIFAIRPQPGFDQTVRAGRAAGLSIEGEPLFVIEPRAWDLPENCEFDGLLLGSANAVRHGGEPLAHLKHVPVHAVGSRTADAATAAGFRVERTGEGGLQSLVHALPAQPGRFLRLAGEDRVALNAPDHIRIVTRVAYASTARPIGKPFADALRGGGLVLLHSARAAAHFAEECQRLDIDPSAIALATLGPRISAAAGPGWSRVEHAVEPSDAALLALAQGLCQ